MPDASDPPPDAGPPRTTGQTRLLAASLGDRAGAVGAALCLAAAQLVGRHLRFDSADPLWPDRDRLTVDPALAGLAAAVCGLAGAPGLCAVHVPTVGCGVGAALAERLLAARFGRSLVDHRSWVLCSGARLASGPVQEAAWLAGAWRLGRLTVIADATDGQPPGAAGFAACGWAVRRAAADDAAAIAAALSGCLRSVKPTLILCTGPARPIEAEGDAKAAWAAAGRRLAGIRRGWLKRLARHGSRTDFEMAVAGRLQGRWHGPLSEPGPLVAFGQTVAATAPTLARALALLPAGMPELAVLPGPAGWPVPPAQTEPRAAARQDSGHLPAGIGAALCGAALHGGLVPLAAAGAAALDALLPTLRAAALASARLVQIIVESAPPTIDHAALHAIAGLQVFRPADASEALECLELAIRHEAGPSVLLLSEAPRPLLAERPARTHCARGGYVVAEALGVRAATLIASGPELDLALQARLLLNRRGVRIAVVSLPCWALFAQQDAAWREGVLGGAPRLATGADGGFGWERWLGSGGVFIAAPAEARKVADAVARHVVIAGLV